MSSCVFAQSVCIVLPFLGLRTLSSPYLPSHVTKNASIFSSLSSLLVLATDVRVARQENTHTNGRAIPRRLEQAQAVALPTPNPNPSSFVAGGGLRLPGGARRRRQAQRLQPLLFVEILHHQVEHLVRHEARAVLLDAAHQLAYLLLVISTGKRVVEDGFEGPNHHVGLPARDLCVSVDEWVDG